MRLRLILGGLLLLVALAAGVAWVERVPLLSWYYLRGLARADDKDVSFWQQRLVALDVTGLRGLINCLRHNDPHALKLPMILSLITVLLLIVSGWLGGKMVYEHGVAVSASTDPNMRR